LLFKFCNLYRYCELTEIVAERHPGAGPEPMLMTNAEKALRITFPGGAGTLGRTSGGKSSPRWGSTSYK
jgi:hypothetical protein